MRRESNRAADVGPAKRKGGKKERKEGKKKGSELTIDTLASLR
jgi:hypothetical protein